MNANSVITRDYEEIPQFWLEKNKANFETAPKPAPSTAFRASSELVEGSKDTQSGMLRNFPKNGNKELVQTSI